MKENHNAFCGYDCRKCPVFIETQNNNLEKLRKILYNNNPNETIETLGCIGCKADKNVNKMCVNCQIRICALEKGISSCGLCDEFPCSKLVYISNETMEKLKMINKERK